MPMENPAPHCVFDHDPGEEEQALFHRVWKRVMPEDRADCPIVPVEAKRTDAGGDLPCLCACPVPRPPETPAPPRGGHIGSDFPDGEEGLALGPASAVYGEQLQRQTEDAARCARTYRQLARRAGGNGCGRILAALAGEKLTAARRLAAAYFLISGVRWWPREEPAPGPLPSFQGMLRRGFLTEQQRARAYDVAADENGDAALVRLYRELAAQCRDHSDALRELLEQMT